jgi:adenylate cyclase
MSEESERKLAAIMFTDIVGYTALTQSDEMLALQVLQRHNKLLRPFFPKYHGKEIKTIGDSFLVEFASALEAILCAAEIQKFLHDYNISASDSWKIKLRIGVHVGDVIYSEHDIFGDTVNIASRIEPLADPEGICISEQVYDQVSNKITYKLSEIEHKGLKNVQTSISVYKVILPWTSTEEKGKQILHRESASSTFSSSMARRIAVLPLTNMSSSPSDEYFSDGMTEEIISTLSRIKEIEVISRTSVMRYKETKKTMREIAGELEAGIILEGSVRKAGDKIRVTVQMINAGSDSHVWSESYDRELKDVFQIQSEIAEGVASMMKSRLLDQDKKEIAKGLTRNPEAFSAYLLGKYLYNRGNKEEQLKGVDSLKRAIKLDPSFASAYASLSICYAYMAGQYISDEEGFAFARKYAERAVQLDDTSSEAHVALGLVALQYDWEWDKAKTELLRAIELNPNDSAAHVWYGFFLGMTLRADEGIQELLKAEELDPLSHVVKLNVGCLLYFGGKYDEAIRKLREALILDKRDEMAYLFMDYAYAAETKYQEAIKEMINSVEAADNSNALGGLGYLYALDGQREKAMEVVKRIEAQRYKGMCPCTNEGMIYVGLGEYEKALDLLEKGLGEGAWIALTFQTRIYDPIRSHPRFIEIAKEVGLPLSRK